MATQPGYQKKQYEKYHGKYKHLEQRKRCKLYGITTEQLKKMESDQEGKCAICGEVPKGKGFQIDHSHRTGKVRGLLCVTCNMKLGSIESEWFVWALNYMGRFQ
jgi:hypothetical protein